jgi:hypothetical protein
MRLVGKGSFFSFEFRSFEISKERHSKERHSKERHSKERHSKERHSKERSIYAYIRTNETFLSKRISKERQTNFERTLFDQTTYPVFSQLIIDEKFLMGGRISMKPYSG